MPITLTQALCSFGIVLVLMFMVAFTIIKNEPVQHDDVRSYWENVPDNILYDTFYNSSDRSAIDVDALDESQWDQEAI